MNSMVESGGMKEVEFGVLQLVFLGILYVMTPILNCTLYLNGSQRSFFFI